MEIGLGFVPFHGNPLTYLKCCHQYVSAIDGWQDTSDPKKVVLDMRSEHFVEALPLWRSIAETTTVQPDVQGSILIQSVTV